MVVKDLVHGIEEVSIFKLAGLACIDPRGKFGELVGRQFFDGGFDFSDGAH